MKKLKRVIGILLLTFICVSFSKNVFSQDTTFSISYRAKCGGSIKVSIITCWCDSDVFGACIPGTEMCAPPYSNTQNVPNDGCGPSTSTSFNTPAVPPGKKPMYKVTLTGRYKSITIDLPVPKGVSVYLGDLDCTGCEQYLYCGDGFNLFISTRF